MATDTVPATLELGAGLTPVGFAPGRYATAVQRSLTGTHALQVLHEDATALLILDLASDGTATACRGWRYAFRSDGPTVHTEERFREQQGYRGRYVVRSGVAELELHTDETLCPMIREHGDRVPRRTEALRLRCVRVEAQGHAMLNEPTLLCDWAAIDVPTPELDALRVPGVVPGRWMILGSGDGLRLRVTGSPPGARAGEPLQTRVVTTTGPLTLDAWERGF